MFIAKIWSNLPLKWKIFLLSFGALILALVEFVVVTARTNAHIDEIVFKNLQTVIEQEVQTVLEGLYDMVKTQDQLLKIKLKGDLAVAQAAINEVGGISFNPEKVTWNVENQFTKETRIIELPQIMIGNNLLVQVRSSKERAYIVDKIRKQLGSFCTILQRMNEQGDMLKVASSFIKENGERDIGSYIPATDLNGKPNQIIQTVLSGKTYIDLAYMANTWYLSAYEPLRDINGKIQGALNVAIPIETASEVRKSIQDIKIGKRGYAWVVNGTGTHKGVTIIHPSGTGINLLNVKSSDGRMVVQEMIDKAIKETAQKLVIYEYQQINSGDQIPQNIISTVAYYEPWNWIIGVSAYEEDISNKLIGNIDFEIASEIKLQLIIVISFMFVVFLISWFVASGIAVPLNIGEELLRKIVMYGDTSELPDEKLCIRKDEIGSLARSIESLIKHQNEIIETISQIAKGNWNQEIIIKSEKDNFGIALQKMVEQVNAALSNVKFVAKEVNSASTQISDTTQSLSQGATETAASVEEISASITEIDGQTKINAENAAQANVLAVQTRSAAEAGNQKMGEMITAMNEIEQASNQIAKIIKVIDDIAFQTNLLALNAAVEAARAGAHGKGFAVVADEVRNLAGRSAKAAKETAEMIENSIKKFKLGSEIARETETALKEIVTSSVKVTDLVGEIAAASNEQAQGITQIAKGLEQIEKVTQQNTASFEETAAAAEELAGHASKLHSMLAKFELRSDQNTQLTQLNSKTHSNADVITSSKKPESTKPLKTATKINVSDSALAKPKNKSIKLKPSDIISLDDDEFGRY